MKKEGIFRSLDFQCLQISVDIQLNVTRTVRSQAGASYKLISVTDQTTNAKVERPSEMSIRSSNRKRTFSDYQGDHLAYLS